MENNTNCKEDFYYGLDLITKDLDSYRNTTFSSSIKYFSHPISIILKEIKEKEKTGEAIEVFYKEKCEELQSIYNRLIITLAITKERTKEYKPSIVSKIKKLFH